MASCRAFCPVIPVGYPSGIMGKKMKIKIISAAMALEKHPHSSGLNPTLKWDLP